MNEEVREILFKYINDEQTTKEEVLNQIREINCPKKTVVSFIWTLINMSKNPKTFKENTHFRLILLINYFAEEVNQYKKLFYIILDRVDTCKFSEANEIRKFFSLRSQSRYLINKYQNFQHNTEGFAHLVLVLLQRSTNPSELMQVIGEHRIDPDVLFNILVDLFQNNNKGYNFAPFFSIFPIEKIVSFAFNGIQNDEKNKDMYYLIISNLILEKKIKLSNLWNIVGKPNDILSQKYLDLLTATKIYCGDLTRVRTILPGMTKEESFPPLYFEREKKFIQAREDISNSFFFRLLSVTKPFDYRLLNLVSQFDPCLYNPIAVTFSNILYNKFKDDPVAFLQSKLNLKYLCCLGCHCTENRLISQICDFPDLIPPFVFSNFLLQSVSLNSCSWQLSIPVYKCLTRYPMDVRYQIYKKFTANQNLLVNQLIAVANSTRKMVYILKRISLENAKNYSMKVAQLFLMAPYVTSERLLNYLCSMTPVSDVQFLVISDLAPLSLDYLFLYICEQVDKMSLRSGSNEKDVSEWPSDIANFMGKIFAQHYDCMDLAGYITFIKRGLLKLKFPYVCLLQSLVTEMTSSNYRGNLTATESEIRAGDNLLRFCQRIESDDREEFSSRNEYFRALIQKDQDSLQILASLDRMTQGSIKDPEMVDKIRFTFIALCDFLQLSHYVRLDPIELIQKYHFSLTAATHISRATLSILLPISPSSIPNELFAYFWSTTVSDFHVPTKRFNEVDRHIRTKIKMAQDEDFRDGLIMIKEHLLSSVKAQRDRVLRIRQEFSDKVWFKDVSVYQNFISQCIMPRMMFSQMDSWFCALFVYSIAHFTDFQMEMFNEHFVSVFHFLVLSATFEESRCIGVFLGKILKFNRDRREAGHLHENITAKFVILLSKNVENVIINSIMVLDSVSKDYPTKKEHMEKLDSLLDAFSAPPGSSITLQIRRYIDNRSTRMLKREKSLQKEYDKYKDGFDKNEDDLAKQTFGDNDDTDESNSNMKHNNGGGGGSAYSSSESTANSRSPSPLPSRNSPFQRYHNSASSVVDEADRHLLPWQRKEQGSNNGSNNSNNTNSSNNNSGNNNNVREPTRTRSLDSMSFPLDSYHSYYGNSLTQMQQYALYTSQLAQQQQLSLGRYNQQYTYPQQQMAQNPYQQPGMPQNPYQQYDPQYYPYQYPYQYHQNRQRNDK